MNGKRSIASLAKRFESKPSLCGVARVLHVISAQIAAMEPHFGAGLIRVGRSGIRRHEGRTVAGLVSPLYLMTRAKSNFAPKINKNDLRKSSNPNFVQIQQQLLKRRLGAAGSDASSSTRLCMGSLRSRHRNSRPPGAGFPRYSRGTCGNQK